MTSDKILNYGSTLKISFDLRAVFFAAYIVVRKLQVARAIITFYALLAAKSPDSRKRKYFETTPLKIKGFRSFFQARQRYSFLHNSVTFTAHPKGISTQVFNTQ